MIEFEDATLIESSGNYEKTLKLMEQDGVKKWMLRSKVFAHGKFMSGCFVINFWNDKRAIIDEMFRPASLDVPNDDIVELSRCLVDNGWELPEPSYKLLETPRMFDFWQRQYQSGLIKSSSIDERESSIVDRISKTEKEQIND